MAKRRKRRRRRRVKINEEEERRNEMKKMTIVAKMIMKKERNENEEKRKKSYEIVMKINGVIIMSISNENNVNIRKMTKASIMSIVIEMKWRNEIMKIMYRISIRNK